MTKKIRLEQIEGTDGFVKKSGDTMSGGLIMPNHIPVFFGSNNEFDLYHSAGLGGLVISRPGIDYALFIKDNLNVGLGTLNPTEKLEVIGKIKATGGNSDLWNEAYNLGMLYKGGFGNGNDYNSFVTPGRFSITSDAAQQTNTNRPSDFSGVLEVTWSDGGNSWVFQRFQEYGGNRRTYTRSFYNGSWSPWVNLWNSQDFSEQDIQNFVNKVNRSGDTMTDSLRMGITPTSANIVRDFEGYNGPVARSVFQVKGLNNTLELAAYGNSGNVSHYYFLNNGNETGISFQANGVISADGGNSAQWNETYSKINNKADIDGQNIPFDTYWPSLLVGGFFNHRFVDTNVGSNFNELLVTINGGIFKTSPGGLRDKMGLDNRYVRYIETGNTQTDLNALSGNYFTYGYNWLNTPNGGVYNGAIAMVTTKSYSPDWITQEFKPLDGLNQVFIRTRHSGTTWSAWTEILTSNSSSNFAKIDGSNISPTTWSNLTSGNSTNWNGHTVDWATSNTNPIDVLGWDNTAQVNRPINRNGLLTWLNLQNDYAYRDSSNILNPTLWRTNLGVYSKNEIDTYFLADLEGAKGLGFSQSNIDRPYIQNDAGVNVLLATQNWVDNNYAKQVDFYKLYNGQVTHQSGLLPNGNQFASIGDTSTNFDGTLSNTTFEGTFANFNGYDLNSKSLGFTLAVPTSGSKAGTIHFKSWYGGSTPWRELWHNGNFDPNTKANTVGTYLGFISGDSKQWNGQNYTNVELQVEPYYLLGFDAVNNTWKPTTSQYVAIGLNPYFAQRDGGNLTNIANWQSVLGINASWNLQQVTQNGNVTDVNEIILSDNLSNGYISLQKSRNLQGYSGAGALDIYLQRDGGNVGIGTTSPNYKLDVNGITHAHQFIASNGGLVIKGTGGVNANTTKIFFENVNANFGWAISQGVNNATQEGLGFGTWDGSTYSAKVHIHESGLLATNNHGNSQNWYDAYLAVQNLGNYVDVTTQNQSVNSRKIFHTQGNTSWIDSAIEVRGNGSTLFPNIAFHQPGVDASVLEMRNDALLYWYNEPLASRVWTINNFIQPYQLANYVNKAGDTMSGDLYGTNARIGFVSNASGVAHYLYNTNPAGYGLTVRGGDASQGTYAFNVENYDGNLTLFRVTPTYSQFYHNLYIPNATDPNHAVAFGQLANYALIDGSNTTGGTWNINKINAPNLTSSNKQIFSEAGTDVYFGNPTLNTLYFENLGELYHYKGGNLGLIWTQHNFNPANYALLSQVPTNNNQLTNGANYTTLSTVQSWVGTQGYLTSFTETDPTVPSHVKNITTGDIALWNAKFTFPGGGSPNQYINYQGVWTNLPGGGGGTITIHSDMESNGDQPLQGNDFFFDSYFEAQQVIDTETDEHGNLHIETRNSGDRMKFWGSYDNTFYVNYGSGTYTLDVRETRKHINTVHGSGTIDVTLEDGQWAGDQANLATGPNNGVVVRGSKILWPSGSAGVFECVTFCNLVWNPVERAWIVIAYGT